MAETAQAFRDVVICVMCIVASISLSAAIPAVEPGQHPEGCSIGGAFWAAQPHSENRQNEEAAPTPSSNRTTRFPPNTNQAEQTIKSYQMPHFEEILIAVHCAIAILIFVYAQKKSTTHKGSSQKTDSVSADALLYNKVLKAYITRENSDPQQAEKVLPVMEENGVMPNRVMEENGVMPNTITAYSNCRPACPQEGICSDLITYTTLQSRIKTYANASPARPEQAEEILALMNSKGMQPNAVSYTTVVTAYANARPPRVQDAERVVLEMEQNGVIADEVTYNSLMKAYAQKPAQPDKAEEILVRMERLGIRPDVISYSSLATSYSNAEKVDTVAAENVLTRMQEKGVVGNTTTYSIVVAAFSNKSPSDPVGAERVIQKMIDNNVKCNTITYCSLICAYRNAGRAAEAACVLDRMAAAGVKADASCYNAVIKAFSNFSNFAGFLEAFAVAERMQDDGIVPNIVTANLLLESAARDLRPSVLPAAQKLFDEIPSPDKYTYPRMLHVLANFSRESEAFDLFHEARKNLACWPNEFVFKAGIRACPSHRHELQQIWNLDARHPRFKEARVHVPQRNCEGKHRRPITHPIKRE